MSRATQSDPRSDLELVAAINSGSADAFEVLYFRHRDYALRLAMRYCQDHALALDAVQDSFIYIYKKFPGFTLTAKFTTFLFPVVKHNALSQKKKARRTQGQSGVDTLATLPAPPETSLTESTAHSASETHPLAPLLASLPEAQRDVLLLRFVDDLALSEIAERLNIPLGTVKTRIHHAIRKLREDPATKKFFEG